MLVSSLAELSSVALTAFISRNANKTKTKTFLTFIFYIMFLIFKNIIVKKIIKNDNDSKRVF